MAKEQSAGTTKRGRPALTPEAQNNKLIALAVDQIEEQLRSGKASSQILAIYTKMAVNRDKERLEKELLEAKVELAKAKTEAIAAEARQEELYLKAIKSMRLYQGAAYDEDEEELQ